MRLVRTAIACGAIALVSLRAMAQQLSGVRVIRRADRGALIIKLGHALHDTVAVDTAVVAKDRLIDLTEKGFVPLAPKLSRSPDACPSPPQLHNQICFVLAGGATLDDTHRYLLVIDSIRTGKGPPILASQTLAIEPVAGHVIPPSQHPVESIIVTYDVDLSHDSTLALRLTVGHDSTPIRITSDSIPGQPRCYNRGLLAFNCAVSATISHGDSIHATFVRVSGDTRRVPAGAIEPAADTVSGAVKDTVISIQGGYSQTTAGRSGTLNALWQNMVLPHTQMHYPRLHFEGSVSPYMSLLWSTDRQTKGYWNLGARYTGYYTSATGPLEVLGLFVTPRTESDKKTTVANFMYLDAEVRLGIRHLFAGSLPLDGYYRVLPHGGVELGHTYVGTKVKRPESNNPSRWKAGVSTVVAWPAVRFTVTGDYQHYFLDDVPPSVTTTGHDWGTINAVYKFTSHVGLSLCYQNGSPPPLFSYQRVIQFGIAVVY